MVFLGTTIAGFRMLPTAQIPTIKLQQKEKTIYII